MPAVPPPHEQPACLPLSQFALDRSHLQPRSPLIIPNREALVEPQCIQHELERQVGRCDQGTLTDSRAITRANIGVRVKASTQARAGTNIRTRSPHLFQIVARLLGLDRAQDALRELEADFAMCTGADPKVI